MALLHMDFYSDTLGMPAEADVILPESVKTQIGMDSKREKVFPTVYLLHGLTDDHTIWQRRTSIERYASRYGIAVVMPNAHRSWYSDMVYGGKYLTFISEELPRVCRAFFNGMSSEREKNYIIGISMGGYGAYKTAMAKPECYAGAASFSGAMEVENYMKEGKFLSENEWRAVFGREDLIRASVNDVYAMTQQRIDEGACLPKLYLSCGTEDGLFSATERMHKMLEKGGIPHFYHTESADHSWDFWDSEIQSALEYFFAN